MYNIYIDPVNLVHDLHDLKTISYVNKIRLL